MKTQSTNMSIWEKESFFAPRDVVIVGAGLAGLWSAYEIKLKYPNASILILERGLIPTGASTRNAGFACFGSPTDFLRDRARSNEETMWRLVEMRYQGINKIRKIFSDEEIDYTPCGGYECLSSELTDIKALEKMTEELNEGMKKITGIDEVFKWSSEKLEESGLSGFDAMISNTLEGGLHSGKLLQALAQKVQSMGVEIMTSVEVTGWEEKGSIVRIDSDKGFTFESKQLVVCTNAFTNEISKDVSITPARGQIIVTSPIPGLKLNGTFHYDEGFYYFRNLGDRVLLGGARNKDMKNEQTNEFGTSEKIQADLESFLSKHILKDKDYTVDYRWSGIMAFTKNYEPLIQHSSSGTVHTVVVCNSIGVATSPIMAEKVAESINL